MKSLKILIFITCGFLLTSCSNNNSNPELVQPEKWWSVHPRPVYSKLQKIGTFQSWFDVYELTDSTYAIYEPNQFEEAICYLITGSKKAVIIDTGTGIGNLKKVVKELTDLPLMVILTHEHYDHVAAAYRFDEIAIFDNPDALKKLKDGRDNASLQKYITKEYLWKPLPEDFDPKEWIIPSIEPTILLNDGDTIDIGNRTLEVIYTPGHSPGSICLLDKRHRILFTGDHFYPGPLYAYPEDVNIDDYIASNIKLNQRIDEFDHLCSGHNDPWVKSDVLLLVSKAFETIFEGKGEFSEDDELRRYYFEGFDILINTISVTDKL